MSAKLLKAISIFFIIFSSLQLVSCGDSKSTNYAPVVDLGAAYAKQRGYYTVSRGETLFFIAWRLDLDYQQLAKANGIKPPYSIRPGQRLRITNLTSEARGETPKAKTGTKVAGEVIQPSRSVTVSRWLWPASGQVSQKFSLYNKGINIDGKLGEPIKASASGSVVYAGSGLSAYGNLLIIKHNQNYLSAYAHCQKLLVKEGAWVKQGQTIALMGSTGTNKVMLHFEIRKNGKPVDPLRYLKR